MTFHEYVCRRRGDYGPVGDFISDTKRVRNFPDVKSLGELKMAMLSTGACPDDSVIESAKEVWADYCASKRRGGQRRR